WGFSLLEPRMRGSVPGHVRVDRDGPHVDSTAQVIHPAETFAEIALGCGLAPDAVVTMKDERRVLGERGEVRLALVERPGAVDAGERALGRRPDVEQDEPALAGQHLFELDGEDRRDLRRLVRVR